MAKTSEPPTVRGAVQRDLDSIAKVDEALASSALAAMALQLAAEMDSGTNSATSKSMCARALMDALEQLRDLMPEGDAKDDLDELSARRATRLAGR